jgi:hypothetical protein
MNITQSDGCHGDLEKGTIKRNWAFWGAQKVFHLGGETCIQVSVKLNH